MLGPEPRGGSLCERLSETCFVQSSGVGVVGGIGKASTHHSCPASLTPASPSALCEQEGDSTRPALLRRCHFSPHFPCCSPRASWGGMPPGSGPVPVGLPAPAWSVWSVTWAEGALAGLPSHPLSSQAL